MAERSAACRGGSQAAAGVKGELDHFAALAAIQAILVVLREAGHPGMLLVLGEVETLQRMRSDVREKGLNALRQLYVCPLRTPLNNLYPCVQGYCDLLRHRAAIWHGDIGDAERKRILAEPPKVLLTTPESIEAMLMSRRVESERFFGGVRAIVVDEIHAFAGDDRGWHLLAILARLDALTERKTQRVGLTATVGNPEWLLDWLVFGGAGEREVVLVSADGGSEVDLTTDWVASDANAAKVIASLHHGEKRLVFADSRSRVESIASALRAEGTTVFVSHSSLSRDDRFQAERAFTETRDCVIVATSTLELGIDIGDLDRVVQIGAPATVARLALDVDALAKQIIAEPLTERDELLPAAPTARLALVLEWLEQALYETDRLDLSQAWAMWIRGDVNGDTTSCAHPTSLKSPA
jgi:Lhr-like helicase